VLRDLTEVVLENSESVRLLLSGAIGLPMISFEPLELLGDPGAGGERCEGQAEREEKALYFGDEVDEKKYTSCKPRGNDPRSLNDFTTEDIEKMNNVSFSDPEYTNKVLLVVNLASF